MLVLELLEHDRETYTALDYTNRYRAWLAFNRLSAFGVSVWPDLCAIFHRGPW